MSAATLTAAPPWTPSLEGEELPGIDSVAEPIRADFGCADPPAGADLAQRKRALEELLRARRLQAEAPPLRGEDGRPRPVATGVAALDRILVGGFPRGELSEIHGPASSGRTGVLLALLSHTTRAGALAALVDPLDRLDASGLGADRRPRQGGGENRSAHGLSLWQLRA